MRTKREERKTSKTRKGAATTDSVEKKLSAEIKDATDAMLMVSTARVNASIYKLPIFKYVRCENA